MRASLIIVFCLISSQGISQNRKNNLVNGTFIDMPLEVIFDSLSARTNYFFSYNSNLLSKGSLYSITAENTLIDQFLSQLLVDTNLKYSFFKDQIIVNYAPVERVVKKKNFYSISGTVYDENGQPLEFQAT